MAVGRDGVTVMVNGDDYVWGGGFCALHTFPRWLADTFTCQVVGGALLLASLVESAPSA